MTMSVANCLKRHRMQVHLLSQSSTSTHKAIALCAYVLLFGLIDLISIVDAVLSFGQWLAASDYLFILFGIQSKLQKTLGGASVHFQLLNKQSRKYFNRVFADSSSAFSSYAVHKANHVEVVQKCLKIDDKSKLVEYLKTAHANEIAQQCDLWNTGFKTFSQTWVPTIEAPTANEAFITKSLDEIYNSTEAPIMDTLFSFNAEVIHKIKQCTSVTTRFIWLLALFLGIGFVCSKFSSNDGTIDQEE